MSGYLEGLRVLDLSRLLPGPYASSMLAEMGADVLKVEDTVMGDAARAIPPFAGNMSAVYRWLNVGKRNLSINLKKPEGREVILRLVKTYDIVLEGFRPGTLDRMGVGYEELKKANPAVILCSLTGYGQHGAYRDRAGHDLNYQSISGVVEMTGSKGGAPGMPGTQMADLGGSYAAVLSILAAVFKRQRTGEGEHIDVAMCDTLIGLQPITYSAALYGGERPKRGESALSGQYVCYTLYETKDGKYMSFGALEPKFFIAFCTAVERPDLVAHHYDPVGEDSQAYKDFCDIFRSKTQEEWIAFLQDVDACCEPVINPADSETSPYVTSRNLMQSFEIEDGSTFKRFPTVPALRKPDSLPTKAANLGEHTREALEEAGFSEEEIEALVSADVVKINDTSNEGIASRKGSGFI